MIAVPLPRDDGEPYPRPGTRLGMYPTRNLAPEQQRERSLERTLMLLRKPAAACVRAWPHFIAEVTGVGRVLAALPEAALDRFIVDLRARLRRGQPTHLQIVRSFATVREVARRELGMSHYDEQLIGGFAIYHGMLAEMATGEGKTLTATLPACTAALAGTPVHIVTVNDYLVTRDAAAMAPVYRRFGVCVGAVTAASDDTARRAQYRADVVYCTNKQLVFDYLRDRCVLGNAHDDLRLRLDALCAQRPRRNALFLRGLYFAIVDEADSVFIDDARTPLILANTGREDPALVLRVRGALLLANQLSQGVDFSRDGHEVTLTARGRTHLADIGAPLGGLWAGERRREMLVTQALIATHSYRRDHDYLVRNGRVEIIDETTGRAMPDRSWEQGQHQMIEAREGVPLTQPAETMARISFQCFFQRYLKLGGMSGTLSEVKSELRRVYGLRVVQVPDHKRSCVRALPPAYHLHADEKWRAIVAAIETQHAAGRAVLAGTRSLADSERLAALLVSAGLPHQVLNARQDADEAALIACAGEPGRITVATNMAGRGTDIKLSPEVLARGGLHVVVCEHNDARRIDRQLTGRAARCGEPGSFQVIGALDDALLSKTFGARWLRWIGRYPALRRPAAVLAQRRLERRARRVRAALLAADLARNDQVAFAGNAE